MRSLDGAALLPIAGDDGGGASAAAAAAVTRERIVGLDLWRALLMLAGLFRHAADWHVGRPFFDAVILVSSSFRMGAFFCISGLLTGHALLHHATESWLRRRLRQLAIPTLVGCALLCPLLSFVSGWTGMLEGRPFALPLNWYHLWFLFALMLYSHLAGHVHRWDLRTGGITRIVARLGSAENALVVTGLLAFTGIGVCAALSERWVPEMLWSPLWEVRWIVGYTAIFFFGFALSRAPGLRAQLLTRVRLAWTMLALVALAYAIVFWGLGGDPAHYALVQPAVFAAGAAFGPLAASLLILRSAYRIRHVPAPLRALADAAFTIYLLHLPFIAILSAGFAFVQWNEYLEFALAAVASGVLSFAAHHYLVRRSPTLSLLLNGRAPAAPRPVPAAPPAFPVLAAD